MGFRGGHCFFAASRRRAESEDGEPKVPDICYSLGSYGSLLGGAGTEQVRQILKASMAVQMCAANDFRAAHRLSAALREEDLFPQFRNESTFLQSVFTKKKAAA